MYRFILGGSGSGKTHKAFTDCISAATADESSHFLLLVPEQSTTSSEKEIVKMHPRHAADNIEVLGFSRLAYKVFGELGIENPKVIDDISKAMIIRKIGAEHKDELKVWRNRFDKPGFVDNLKSMISELYLYGISSEDIAGSIDLVDGQLRNKMHDLNIIYSAFKDAIRDKYVTLEEIPDILAANIHKSDFIKNAYIVLDGFTGFTPVQYRIIENFLCYAREVVITVSIGEDRESDIFDMSREMIDRIIDIASKNGVNHGRDTVLGTEDFLERHFLRYDGARGHIKDDELRIIHAGNTADEAAFVVNDIERLVKTCNYRYKDIAVVCSDISRYKSLLNHEMELAEVPYYVDESIDIADNPLLQMIEAAFDIMHSDYSYESVMRYLKTGLISVSHGETEKADSADPDSRAETPAVDAPEQSPEADDDMINVMDNYIYECGRRGYKRMRASWDFMPRDLEDTDRIKLNEYKNAVLDSLEELRELVSGNKKADVNNIVTAVKKLLEANQVREKLERIRDRFTENGDRAREREYSAVYEKITELLDGIAGLLDGEKLTGQEFSDIFTAGAAQIKLGMIPSGTDRITIGDITRSRLDGIRALYVIGANDGSIPKLLSRGNVITDTEKEKLKEAGFELSPTVREDLLIQRYYLYRLFTKPGDKLTVTYAGLDLKGSQLQPSYIIGYLTGLYDNLKIEEAVDVRELYNISSAVRRVGEKLRDIRSGAGPDAEFGNLYAYLIGDEKTREKIQLITSAALYVYKQRKLDKESVDLLYGDSLMSSVSKLENYAQCPYSYFATYGLKLAEIEPFALRVMDIGNLAHSALEKIFSEAKKLRIDLTAIDAQACEAMVHRCIEEAMLDDESSKYTDTARNAYIVKRVEKIVGRSFLGLLEKQGDGFVPYAFEWGFGAKDRLESTRFDLGGGRTMLLSGIVDRTDIREDDSSVGVRIIDYKSGKKTWDWSDIVNGRDMQITMYMAAVSELIADRFKGKKIIPEEMFYYTLKDPIIDKDKLKKKTVEEALRDEMSFAGLNEREAIDKVIPYVEGKAEGFGKMIASGDVRVEPSAKDMNNVKCNYCRFRAVCGFDPKISGYRYSMEKKYDNEQAWQIISGQEATQS
ncbi:MAG: exodeoxyribonuclease V subunit gamma [Lachnospiraceae bacterium]|nr:exodeoxyribonuclease V subunit gamma [Lachnospiraceae bacterium]